MSKTAVIDMLKAVQVSVNCGCQCNLMMVLSDDEILHHSWYKHDSVKASNELCIDYIYIYSQQYIYIWYVPAALSYLLAWCKFLFYMQEGQCKQE
jgi:hypothetical protein